MAAATVIDPLPTPEMLVVGITTACDRHCAFCAWDDFPPSAMLDRATVARAIREARELGIATIVLGGGEPLLHPEIDVILDDACAGNVVLFTNGGRIVPTVARTMASRRSLTTVVNLSASGFPAGRRSSEGGAWDAIERLADAGAQWGVSLVAMRSNADDLIAREDDLAALAGRGCAMMFIFEYLPVGRNATAREILTTPQRWKVRRLAHSLQTRGLPSYAIPSFEEGTGGCRAGGRGFLHINPSGGIEPCPFIRHSEENIHTTTLRAALQSPFMKAIRQRSSLSPSLGCPVLAAHAEDSTT